MRSRERGGPPELPPADPAVTYSRLDEAEELPGFVDDSVDATGRREPRLTAVRVDPPKRRRERSRAAPVYVDGLDSIDSDDGFAERPLAIDPEEFGAAPPRERQRPRRRRSGALRLVLLVGALAVIGGVGVLGATVVKVLYGQPQAASAATASAPAPDAATGQASAADPTAAPVATTTDVLPDSGSAGPGVLAIPSDGGPVDMTPAAPASAAPQAALSPIPPPAPRTVAPPAQPAPQPAATARTEAPALAQPALTKPAPSQPVPVATANVAPAGGSATDADIDSALSDVDRLLAEKKAAAGQPSAPTAAAPAAMTAPGAPQPLNQAAAPAPLAIDQSAALNITPPGATVAPPLPAPNTVSDPSIPVPPADIPNPTN